MAFLSVSLTSSSMTIGVGLFVYLSCPAVVASESRIGYTSLSNTELMSWYLSARLWQFYFVEQITIDHDRCALLFADCYTECMDSSVLEFNIGIVLRNSLSFSLGLFEQLNTIFAHLISTGDTYISCKTGWLSPLLTRAVSFWWLTLSMFTSSLFYVYSSFLPVDHINDASLRDLSF